MARNTTGMKRGWNYDKANNRLALMVDGTEIANFNASSITWNVSPLTLSYPLTHTDAVTMATDKKMLFRDSGIYINSGADGKVTISADGAGADDITMAGTVTASDNITVASGKSIIGAGTGTNGIVLKNLKNAAAGTLEGTPLNVEIDIGGTPYYFAVYPTKS